MRDPKHRDSGVTMLKYLAPLLNSRHYLLAEAGNGGQAVVDELREHEDLQDEVEDDDGGDNDEPDARFIPLRELKAEVYKILSEDVLPR